MLEASSSLGSTRNWSQPEPISHQIWNMIWNMTWNTNLTGSSERAKTATSPLVFTPNRKRGDQGMDAKHYTERTGTASNNLAALVSSMRI